MVATPDFRIRFDAPRIDFGPDGLGTDEGLPVDSYPAPGSQARYDHMRSVILGLLAHQASVDTPAVAKPGAFWFDLNDATLKVYLNGEWSAFSTVLGLADGVTLQQWYDQSAAFVAAFAPEVTFTGTVVADGTAQFNIPASLRSSLTSTSRPYVWVNGLLQDPRLATLVGSPTPTTIRLTGYELQAGDAVTVVLRSVTDANFHSDNVSL